MPAAQPAFVFDDSAEVAIGSYPGHIHSPGSSSPASFVYICNRDAPGPMDHRAVDRPAKPAAHGSYPTCLGADSPKASAVVDTTRRSTNIGLTAERVPGIQPLPVPFDASHPCWCELPIVTGVSPAAERGGTWRLMLNIVGETSECGVLEKV